MAGGMTDVEAAVWVGRMAEDTVALLVEGVHRPPGKRDRLKRRNPRD
jgi:hypothetical protein